MKLEIERTKDYNKQEEMSLISIIVPVYNVEKYLARCIESILAQTYEKFELIIVNDGSPDDCDKIIKKYGAEDERIFSIYQKNKGLSAARNTGIDVAKGDYLTFIDSDDYVYPEYLEKLMDSIKRNKADISLCGDVRFSDERNLKINTNFIGEKIYTGKEACNLIYDVKKERATYVVAWGKLYRRELFFKHRYPLGKIHEDQFLTYKVMYDAKKIVEIGECLYGYYVNLQGIMNSTFTEKRYDGIEAFEEAEKFFEQKKEVEIVNIVRKEKKILIAQNLIKAKKAGIYRLVPQKYKMSFFKAIKELKEVGGIERYEYFMYQFYPKFITFEARLRKIKRVITRTDY